MTFSALDSAVLGPLFTTDEMRALFSDRALVADMLRVEATLARASAQHGLAPEGLAAAIEAIDPATIDLDALGAATALAGVPVIPFVKAVQARLPADLEPFFHRGATTQDILDTARMLAVKAALDLIARDAKRLIAALAALAERHRETPCAGRTYGQHAAPVTFGFKVAVWLAGVADALAELMRLRRVACAVSLGGPVGTLATLGENGHAVAEAMGRALGLFTPAVPWHARRGRIVQLGSFLAVLTGALAKIATDVVDLSATEVGEVAEPWVAGRGGSSAMPHKRNPVGATVILAAASAAKGHVVTLLDGLVAAHERPAGAWHGEWHALPQLFGLASGALREAIAIAEGLEVDAARMRANLDATRGLLFAEAAAARLAPAIGRETAHVAVERAARAVRDGAPGLRTALIADPVTAGALTRADLDAVFDIGPHVAAAARAVDRQLATVPSLHDLLDQIT